MINLEQIETKSIADGIPYVRKQTLALLIDLIKNNNIKSILEIGTGYGYSALGMSCCSTVNKIVTIEKNTDNYLIAKEFLKNTLIQCINTDAFVYEPQQQFDLIFIDGPKSHQEQLVEKYVKYLSKNGLIIIDNIYLKKFTQKTSLTKNQASLVKKIKQFHQWLISHKTFDVKIYDVDDGIAIVKTK